MCFFIRLCVINLAIRFGAGHGDDDKDHAVATTSTDACIPDDGVTMAEVDLPEECRDAASWVTCPEWTCENTWEGLVGMVAGAETTTLEVNPVHDIGGHKCMNHDVSNLYPKSGYPDGIPNSGYHRAKWPVYGEYRWMAPIRYIHSLEHGAIVFMYHPCAPKELVDGLRSIATSCLWKHLFFAFRDGLDKQWPMAVLSYGHILKINAINEGTVPTIKHWIKQHALIGGNKEGRVFGDGVYNLTLLHKAEIVTVIEDSEICPEPKVEPDAASDNSDALLEEITEVSGPPPTQNLTDVVAAIIASQDGASGLLDQVSNVAALGNPVTGSPAPEVHSQIPKVDSPPNTPVPSVISPVSKIASTSSVEPVRKVSPLVPLNIADESLETMTQAPIESEATVKNEEPVKIEEPAKIEQPAIPDYSLAETTILEDETTLGFDNPRFEPSKQQIQSSTPPETTEETTFTTTSAMLEDGDSAVGNTDYDYRIDDYSPNLGDDATNAQSIQLAVEKSSEPIWAFLSLSILVIGLAVAVYKSQLCKRPNKKYNQNPESWSDDEGSMSVATLIRGFRRKSKDHGHSDVTYALLKAEDENDI